MAMKPRTLGLRYDVFACWVGPWHRAPITFVSGNITKVCWVRRYRRSDTGDAVWTHAVEGR